MPVPESRSAKLANLPKLVRDEDDDPFPAREVKPRTKVGPPPLPPRLNLRSAFAPRPTPLVGAPPAPRPPVEPPKVEAPPPPKPQAPASTSAVFWGQRWPALLEFAQELWGGRAVNNLYNSGGLHATLEDLSMRSTDAVWAEGLAALRAKREEPALVASYLAGILRRKVEAFEKDRLRAAQPFSIHQINRPNKIVPRGVAALQAMCNRFVAREQGLPDAETREGREDGGDHERHRLDRHG